MIRPVYLVYLGLLAQKLQTKIDRTLCPSDYSPLTFGGQKVVLVVEISQSFLNQKKGQI